MDSYHTLHLLGVLPGQYYERPEEYVKVIYLTNA
jgi:hypothetical protein